MATDEPEPDPKSQTLIEYGRNLLTKTLQPGWTVESDGFGLLQSRCTFKIDIAKIMDIFGITQFNRGDAHPYYDTYPTLKLYKASYVSEKGGVATVTAEYCGVDYYIHTDGFTDTQCAMVGSSASEDIVHHPNFIRKNCTSSGLGSPLAGPPPADGGLTGLYNNALWTPKNTQQGALLYQQFVGFMPSQTDAADKINIKAGVKSYYKPQITVRALFYVQLATEEETLLKAVEFGSYVGWVTDGSTFNLPQSYIDLTKKRSDGGYAGNFTYVAEYEALIHRNFLVTNCSVELFGTTCKVTADLMLSGISGWDPDIYPAIDGEDPVPPS
jgi:hypothetical protein